MGHHRIPALFVPIIGPLIGVVIFTLAGPLVAKSIWGAFIPAGRFPGHPQSRTRHSVLSLLVLMCGAPGAILSLPAPGISECLMFNFTSLWAPRKSFTFAARLSGQPE